jgi:hypothetical protein
VKTLLTALATGALFASSAPVLADVFAPAADTQITEADQLVYEVRLRLPHGPSQFVDGLATPLELRKFKFVYLAEASCSRAPFANLFVRSVADGKWYGTRLNVDVLTHDAGAFNAIRIDFDNPYGYQSCNFRILSVDGGGTDQPDTPWGPGVRVGGIQFNGGFSDTVNVEIDPARKIRGFKIAIPEFCSETEILEAGTVTEGVFEAGNLVDGDEYRYAVGTDGPTRARSVQFVLNGPADVTCYVPVYAYYVQ